MRYRGASDRPLLLAYPGHCEFGMEQILIVKAAIDLGSGPGSSSNPTRLYCVNKLGVSRLTWQQKANKLCTP
jgi:hypothetical protein